MKGIIQSAFMEDLTLTHVEVIGKRKPELTSQYRLVGLESPLVSRDFVATHLNDEIPNQIEVTVPGARYSLKGNPESVSKALKEITR